MTTTAICRHCWHDCGPVTSSTPRPERQERCCRCGFYQTVVDPRLEPDGHGAFVDRLVPPEANNEEP